MLKGILITTNSDLQIMKYEDTYENIKEIIGGYIEYVHIKDNMYMIVDEEGLLKNLEYNPIASNLYAGGYIAGNALIVATKSNGDNTSLTKEQIEEIYRRAFSCYYM